MAGVEASLAALEYFGGLHLGVGTIAWIKGVRA